MPRAAGSSPSRYISMNLQPDHVDRLDDLAAHAGMTRNRFLRYLFERLTKKDVDDLMRR